MVFFRTQVKNYYKRIVNVSPHTFPKISPAKCKCIYLPPLEVPQGSGVGPFWFEEIMENLGLELKYLELLVTRITNIKVSTKKKNKKK